MSIRVWALTFALAVAGCSSKAAPADGEAGDARATDATGTDVWMGDVAVACGTVTCAPGQQCCFATGQCFDPGCPSCCGLPADASTPYPGDSGLCASNADCPATQYCLALTCLGVGRCVPRCDTPPELRGRTPVCACGGVTLPNECEASIAGIRIINIEACDSYLNARGDGGTTGYGVCGPGGVCPSGQTCCGITGRCVLSSCSTCCRQAPAGTRIACELNSDCWPAEYCGGASCGAPGGCVLKPRSNCSGEVAQVCGCDGRTYTNECWAAQAGVRIVSRSPCS